MSTPRSLKTHPAPGKTAAAASPLPTSRPRPLQQRFILTPATPPSSPGRNYAYGATPPAMSTPGSSAMAIGFTVMLLSVSAGMHSGAGGLALLLGFTGVLVGASLVAADVHMTDHPAATLPAPFGVARALTAFVRRNTAAVGLFMASCAVTMVTGEAADPVLCFGMFALLLLAVSLISIGVRGE